MTIDHLTAGRTTCHLCDLTALTTCAACGRPTCAAHTARQYRHYVCFDCLDQYTWLREAMLTRRQACGMAIRQWDTRLLRDI